MRDLARHYASLLEQLTAGKNSDQQCGLTCAEAREIARVLTEPAGPKKRSGLSSKSKLNKKPDTPYMAWVRGHGCCFCGTHYQVEAHHAGRKKDKGIGQKPPDDRCVPLCLGCHREYHDLGQVGELTPEQTRRMFDLTVVRMQKEWEKRQAGNEF